MPRRVGAYGKLLANYASDDAIIAAGQSAELLFCRAIAFLAASDSDGFITDGQLVRVVGAGMRDAPKRAAKLVEHGLWIKEDGGYTVRSWLKIHESAEEKGRIRRTDQDRKRRTRRTESERSPNGQAPDSGAPSDRSPEGVTADSLDCSYVSSPSGTEQSNQGKSRARNPKPVTDAIRAYVGACTVPPAAALQAKVERSARALLTEGHPPNAVVAAAANAGRAGWTDLAIQMQRDAATIRGAPDGGRASTTDQRVTGALDLATNLERKALG